MPGNFSRRSSAADESSVSRSLEIAELLDPYRCSDCGTSYRQRIDFVEHLRASHPRASVSYLCSRCGVEHADFEALRRHVEVRHRSRRVYECAHCQCWFDQRRAIERHLERHEERQKRRACSLCSVVFASRAKFKAHWRVKHELARDHVCTVCGQRFIRSYNLRRHDLAKHRRDGKTRRWAPRCEMCGKVFSKKHQLDEHRCRVSVSDEPATFVCNVCGQRFGTKENMLIHEKIHEHKQQQNKCRVCNHEFLRKEHLLRHNRIHADKCICCNCHKTYKTTGSLDKHKKTCGNPVAGPSNAQL